VLDFGWAELLIIIVVAVFVIGPKDIPNVMFGLGRIVKRIQYIRFAISQQFDDLMQVSDIEELRRGVNFEHKSEKKSGGDTAQYDEQSEDEGIAKPQIEPQNQAVETISKDQND